MLHIDPVVTEDQSHGTDHHGALVDRYVNLQREHQRVGREWAQLEDLAEGDLVRYYTLCRACQAKVEFTGGLPSREGKGHVVV